MTLKAIQKWRKKIEERVDSSLKNEVFNLMKQYVDYGYDLNEAAKRASATLDQNLSDKDILRIVNVVNEDAPTNAAGFGNIAGLPPDDPPVTKRMQKKNQRKKHYGEVFPIPEDAFKHFINKKELPEGFKYIDNFSVLYPKINIVLENKRTGAMMFYVRRKGVSQIR